MEVVKGEKQNIILGKKASVNAVVLTPLTPFNSLTPKFKGLPEFGVMVLYFSGSLLIKKYCKPLNISFL